VGLGTHVTIVVCSGDGSRSSVETTGGSGSPVEAEGRCCPFEAYISE